MPETQILYHNSDAWVLGPDFPEPWAHLDPLPSGYNLAPDQLLMVLEPNGYNQDNLSSGVFQLSPDAKSWVEIGTIGRKRFGANTADLSLLCG